MSDERRARFEAMAREWTGRVHHLAYRMLGNRADADDATQEVFLRLWERMDAYDPTRPFQPWIYRVATHAILNRARGEGRRARREEGAPPAPLQEPTEVTVERRERERVVHEGLQAVPGASRALLALHYYGGLTQDEMALVLDVPRTTVQARLARSLDQLRAGLRRAGHLAVVPFVEESMRGALAPPLDPGVLSSVLQIGTAASGATTAAAVGWVIGGIVVSKTLVAATVLAVALGLGGGYLWGRTTVPDTSRPEASSSTELARLADENRRLRAQVDAAAGQAPTLAGRTEPAHAGAAGGTPATPSMSEASVSAGASPGVEFQRFAKLIATNLERITAMSSHEDDDAPPTGADQKFVLQIMTEYASMSEAARAVSPHPFFDERVLPAFASSLFGEGLALSAEQRAALGERVRGILAERAKEIDFDTAGPVEMLQQRRRIAREVVDMAGRSLSPEAKKRFDALEPIARGVLDGDREELRIGIGTASSGNPIGAQVLQEWRAAYGLDDTQAQSLRAVADEYARNAADVLRRRGLDRDDAHPTTEETDAADTEMIALQVPAERAIDRVLTEAQRARRRDQSPHVVLLQGGNSTGSTMIGNGGF